MFQTRYLNTCQTYQTWIDDHPPSQTGYVIEALTVAHIMRPSVLHNSVRLPASKTVSWRHIAVQKFLVKPMLNPCFIISVDSTSAIQPGYHGATAQLPRNPLWVPAPMAVSSIAMKHTWIRSMSGHY
jgi:hypothetical protein